MESHRTCPIQRSDEGWHGRLVPKAGTFCSWCHQSFRAADDQTEVGEIERSWGRSWGHPPEVGATPQSARTRSWGHPPIRADNESPELGPPVSSSLTGTAVEPKTVPPRFSPKQCHPSVRRHHADLRCHPAFRVPRWCHPSVCRVCAKMGPPAGSGASDRAIFGATPRSARQTPPTWCHPPVRHRQIRPGSPRLNSATRQFGGIMRILGS
jgi:hypothetical protein